MYCCTLRSGAPNEPCRFVLGVAPPMNHRSLACPLVNGHRRGTARGSSRALPGAACPAEVGSFPVKATRLNTDLFGRFTAAIEACVNRRLGGGSGCGFATGLRARLSAVLGRALVGVVGGALAVGISIRFAGAVATGLTPSTTCSVSGQPDRPYVAGLPRQTRVGDVKRCESCAARTV